MVPLKIFLVRAKFIKSFIVFIVIFYWFYYIMRVAIRQLRPCKLLNPNSEEKRSQEDRSYYISTGQSARRYVFIHFTLTLNFIFIFFTYFHLLYLV